MELAGRLLLDGALVPGRVMVEGERISAVRPDPGLAGSELPLIVPGLIDLHVHGYGGAGPRSDLAAMARALAAAGTTSFQPTLFPAEPERLGREAEAVWTAAQALEQGAAQVLGLHLEGPFVNPARAGALPREDLAAPSVPGLRAILGPATGDGRGVRTVTLAPELAGAADLVRELGRAGVRVSLGHSAATAAEARTASRAATAGVGATHLFNAMSGVHHREPGLASLALTDGALHAELIGDLTHVGREGVELALAAKGPRRLCLVSDALAGAGTGCRVFHSHGREHLVRAGAAWVPPAEPGGEPRLAGSATGQLEQVRGLVAAGVVTAAEALTMASEAPARALGLEHERGRLVPGARADLLRLVGTELRLDGVWIAGRVLTPPRLPTG